MAVHSEEKNIEEKIKILLDQAATSKSEKRRRKLTDHPVSIFYQPNTVKVNFTPKCRIDNITFSTSVEAKVEKVFVLVLIRDIDIDTTILHVHMLHEILQSMALHHQ